MRTSVLLRRFVSQRLSPLRAAFPSFVRTATISPPEPRSRRLFKAPRRLIPERVPSKRALALHQGSTRTTDLIVRVRLRRTVFNRDFFEPSPARHSRIGPCPPDLSRRRRTLRPARSIAKDASLRLLQTTRLLGHPADRSIFSSSEKSVFNTVDAVTLASVIALLRLLYGDLESSPAFSRRSGVLESPPRLRRLSPSKDLNRVLHPS